MRNHILKSICKALNVKLKQAADIFKNYYRHIGMGTKRVTSTVDGTEQTKNDKLIMKDNIGHFFWLLVRWKQVMYTTDSIDGHSKSCNCQMIRKYDNGCPVKITTDITEDFVHWDLNGNWRNRHDSNEQLENKLN